VWRGWCRSIRRPFRSPPPTHPLPLVALSTSRSPYKKRLRGMPVHPQVPVHVLPTDWGTPSGDAGMLVHPQIPVCNRQTQCNTCGGLGHVPGVHTWGIPSGGKLRVCASPSSRSSATGLGAGLFQVPRGSEYTSGVTQVGIGWVQCRNIPPPCATNRCTTTSLRSLAGTNGATQVLVALEVGRVST
jgi:hypothetical protein